MDAKGLRDHWGGDHVATVGDGIYLARERRWSKVMIHPDAPP